MSTTTHPPRGERGTALFAGAGIGLLVGFIMGLSVTPVVSVILGALASLLAVFLGVQDGLATRTGPDAAEQARIAQRLHTSSLKAGAFGFGCVLGILVGLYLRGNETLMSSPAAQVARYVEAGLAPEYARQLWVLEKFGIPPGGGEAQMGEMQKAKTNALFSGAGDANGSAALCEALKPERYNNDPSEVAWGYKAQDRPELDALAGLLLEGNLSSAEKQTLTQAIAGLLCTPSD